MGRPASPSYSAFIGLIAAMRGRWASGITAAGLEPFDVHEVCGLAAGEREVHRVCAGDGELHNPAGL